jgi:hypothetical protein
MKVKFLSPVNAGTEVHSVGDTADLPNTQAKELIACGAAEVFDPAAAKAEAQAKAQAAAEADAKAKAEQAAAAELAAKAQG